ncbi:MAG: flagellar basal body-associated FliL family protein [Nitrospinae bacterium]|nr:flagellar basal body-associated FliL family protein [Nitrospinota bacterium]
MRYFKLPIIIVIPLLLILLGGGVLFIIWGKRPPSDEINRVERPSVEGPSIVETPEYSMSPFFLPIVDIGKEERFLKIAINLELSNQEVSGEIERNLSILRENLLFLFKRKTVRELQEDKDKTQLSNEIITTLNSSLQSGTIKRIYFAEFLIL